MYANACVHMPDNLFHGLRQVCSCIGIRALLLPVSIAAIRGSREKAILQPEYEKLMQQQKVPGAKNSAFRIISIN